jgi:predicted AlkP superfamily phosphohydrolase/phosphomutase
MNVEGREPRGLIPHDRYEIERNELKARLEAIEDENGVCIGTRAFKAEEVYREVRNIPPDLITYLGNLDWRSAGSVGVGSVYLYENDTGPDDANHAEEGIFIWQAPGGKTGGPTTYSIYDITPTVLDYFGIEIPDEMIGKSILE